jgi:hypothetical protein
MISKTLIVWEIYIEYTLCVLGLSTAFLQQSFPSD